MFYTSCHKTWKARCDRIITKKKAKNLTIGGQYKYPQLCEVLTETQQRGGNSKKIQLENWKRYFTYDYDKQSKLFTISQIMDKPLPKKVDGRKAGNKVVYRDLIAQVLYNDLKDLPECESTYTYKQLSVLFGFCNAAYYEKDNRTIISDLTEHGVTQQDILKFDTRFRAKSYRIIMNALDQLGKRNFIAYTKKQYVVDDNGHREATAAELQLLEQSQQEVLKILGCNEYREVFFRSDFNSYNTKLHDLVFIRMGIRSLYKVLQIRWNQDLVFQTVSEEPQKELNKAFANTVHKAILAESKAHTKFNNEIQQIYENKQNRLLEMLIKQ